MTEEAPDLAALEEAGEILKAGGLVAFPTETVYGLGGDGLNPASSRKIYAAKGRPSDNPLIIHIASMESLTQIAAEIPEAAKRLADAYWPGPLTMIFPKKEIVPYETTGGLDTVAVRFPSSRIAQEMIRRGGGFVAAPSANLSGRPSPTTAQHVVEDLGDRIDMILDGGQVQIGLESTIVDFTEEIPVILRPGYINPDMLRQVLGQVRMDPGLTASAETKVRPKAPGMRYRHYAPKGQLTVVEGPEDSVCREICALAAEKAAEGCRVRIFCTEESRELYPAEFTVSLGARAQEETIAYHLYDALRKCDEDGIEHIFSEAFNTPRIGQAVMNRLLKAAGHRVIRV